MSITENKLEQLRSAIIDIERIVEESEELDSTELNLSLRQMEVTINDFLDEVHALEDVLSEATEAAEDAESAEDDEESEEEDEDEGEEKK